MQSSLLKRSYDSIFVFTHRQADPDALCSGYAVSELFLKMRPRKASSEADLQPSRKIVAPQGASLLGTNVCRALSIPFEEKIDEKQLEEADLIVAVDVGEINLLEPYLAAIARSKALKILIDHHSSIAEVDKPPSSGSEDLFDYRIVDRNATSTCEIVTGFFPSKLLDQRLSKILLAGLLFDSQHLSIATDRTLEAALKLVKKGARIDETKDLLKSKPDRSEIIARLKSSQRLKYREVRNYLLAETQVSSFQASVARMLLDIGADIGIAFGEHEVETRLSIRTTQRFFRETGIDVGVLLSKISKDLGIDGGGHPTAASISGKVSYNILLERIILNLTEGLPQI